MNDIEIINRISEATNTKNWQITNVIKLLNEGSTIPFISRYRKELTGSLNEVIIAEIKEQYEEYLEINKRKVFIINEICKQNKLTEDLKHLINNCYNKVELEDLYLPFKSKRKTKAEQARLNGLEKLAQIIMLENDTDILKLAKNFFNENIKTADDAINGAINIISEIISENIEIRNLVRKIFNQEAEIISKVINTKIDEAVKFSDYFDFKEKLSKCPSHRILAIRRGENEGFLKVKISIDIEVAIYRIEKRLVKNNFKSSEIIKTAINDSLKRLLLPSIENEFASLSKEIADSEAIKVFSENLRQLLLLPPVGNVRVLAIDPGFKTGCKIACINEEGNILHNETIYPHNPVNDYKNASKKITSLVNAYKIEYIAIGNATAGRETEFFIKNVKFEKPIKVFMVSEAGASVYSASSVAREELPQYDVTVRGAVSIGRRLQDPLSELVKIDPKAIGVGQYQHDVDQNKLKKSLDLVVEECVNKVGVNINCASKYLLSYVSGIGESTAKNIINYIKENGPFKSRSELMKVDRFGGKAFEQSAGFLRIIDAVNPLDNTAVHPERYNLVEKICKDFKCDISKLINNKELISKINIEKYITNEVGIPTLNDLILELEKPGRDIRKAVKIFEFSNQIKTISDLKVGMKVPGIITNITNFGAFVDIGIKQNGLIHISNICDEFIKNPIEKLKLNQQVIVKVIEVDIPRARIQLSLKD